MSIFQDYSVNVDPKSRLIMILYRSGNLLYRKRKKISPLPYYLFQVFYRVLVEWVFCVELPLKTRVGKRLSIYHGFGLVVNPKVTLGNNIKLRNGVVIGNNGKSKTGSPVIEDNVDIGANAVVIGEITIGYNTKIGAGTVVTKTIESNKVVVSGKVRIL
ncbi:serine acetyltransferase [Pseudoalteromonas sp. APC 3358]|uniref:serine acetyltransferase n=1 Tax=Pseudoalteromonas sp. APC 3358 TaxID=3035176 RepID=UPI0025B5D337|nr:serine acetyltransferase [Pseudoalteromonas sp. APC 3358]MDN3384683.1 serine acetyltransferase [Pseudoalteromonas sp. APC 3358]